MGDIMKFEKMNLLNEVVFDYQNPDKIYNLAREYDRLEQGAGAFSWYLRAADMSPGKTWEEKWIQYKSMILGAMIYHRNGNRNHSTEGLLKIAIETMPERPEAYYFISKHKQDNQDWRESLMYASIGLSFIGSDKLTIAPDNDVNYPGDDALRLLYARAKWKTDGRDESKNLAFDIRYKRKPKQEVEVEAEQLLQAHGYPSTLAYTKDLSWRLKHQFLGYDKIETNYARHFQDIFVLAALDGKENGTFVEVGSGHPELYSNTYLLEKDFGWKGLSIDNSERLTNIFSKSRNTTCLLADALEIDYQVLFKANNLEEKIDFLRINAEQASLTVLERMPFKKHEFGVIQFQHNAIWWGPEFRDKSRKLLAEMGYILLVGNVAVDPKSPYEDWWVHPQLAKTKMKSNKRINFAWDYMMEKL